MDRNQIIGLTLMFALLAVYFTWFAPDAPQPEELTTQQEPATETIQEATPTDSVTTLPVVSDSEQNSLNTQKYGAFAFAASGDESIQKIENEELIINLSNKGGRIKDVILKNHKDYLGNDLVLVDGSKSKSDLVVDHNGRKINLSELAFAPTTKKIGDTTQISFVLTDGNFSIIQKYLVPPKGFEIAYSIESKNLNTILNPTDVNFNWNHAINRAEAHLEDGRINSNVRYLLANGDYDELSERSTEFEDETLGSQVKWVSFKQKFFTAAIIAKNAFQSGYVNQTVDFGDTTSVKNLSMQMLIPYSDFANEFKARYFFGPNNYRILKKVAPDFEENLDMGWGPLPLVNKYLIIPIFHFLEGFLSNYGIIILLIVIVIRLILAPLTWKSHMSMAKMRAMKPELDEIKAKHDGDMQKAQQEQMKLYQQVGINPVSGCIPMLLQMPILFALFFFFPNAVELRQEAFLWAHDLSTYDSIINLPFEIPFYGDHVSLFTLLMTLSTILYTWSNSQITTVQGPMKTLQYMMPIMFLFVLNSYASGLTFYYFVSNMVTFGQTLLFRKIIDEDKIHALLQENKKKNANKKKSKFQQRLEDAMKANQEAQKKSKKKK
ncbi:YidC/Oxa1 family membrane protein insertase [Ekhidna lutea]|uniref:Membrane protein insertase YidC n=1 Tax=Ekhidna lutea TaxID=447679 RepID=A0A239HF21_EKHLU|nr:membrane protein insertase YidC [Ekhidna lutea]SNS79423.1 YidC/Oxa1 family membrane protein insertase [Ekhidna lutea]